jgi:hypothetical protein
LKGRVVPEKKNTKAFQAVERMDNQIKRATPNKPFDGDQGFPPPIEEKEA